MHFSKNLQYAVSGVLAVYIVFFTRPAPQMVVNLLSSPIAQLAALAAIVYVGASVSLLVALVSAVALVLSIPAREYLTVEKDEEKKKKEEEKKKPVADAAKQVGTAALGGAAAEASNMLANLSDKAKDTPAPMPAAHPVANASGNGKEGFLDGAPF
jgi:predicted RND superfamily exporter protein